MRFFLAFRVFFKVMFNGEFASAVESAESGPPALEAPKPEPKPQPKPEAPKPPARSEALTLLATLQREARLVDFLQESIEGYDDAQIGAAVRDVHRDCAAALKRMFDLRPLVEGEEGDSLEVPAGFDSGSYKLVGNVTGDPPYRGQLVHPGWLASCCKLPAWNGSDASARVVAPTEVELK